MADHEPERARSPWFRRLFFWALAAVALGFVIHAVPIREVQAALADANIPLVALLTASSLLTSLVWAWRWRALVELAKIDVPLLHVWRVILESQAASLILPGGIGGDAVRIGAMVGRGAPAATVVASVLLDRAIGLVTLASIASIASFALGSGGALAFGLAAIPAGFVAGLLVLRRPALSRGSALGSGLVSRTLGPVLAYLGDPGAPRAILRSLAGGVATSAMQILVVRALILALGATPTEERWIYGGFVLFMMVLALPAAPGGWGTGDAAFVVLVGRAGIAPATALAASLLFRLGAYLCGTVGAVLFFLRGGSRSSAPRGG